MSRALEGRRMRPVAWTVLGCLLLELAGASLLPQGVKCKEKRCGPEEYCSQFDDHCRPCAEACDLNSRNHQPEECARDCQAYLHDQRYLLRSELEEYQQLRGEIRKLWILCILSITLTCLSSLCVLLLLVSGVGRLNRLKSGIRRAFTKSWAKTTTTVKSNKVQDDAELGAGKQNGLRVSIPTISGSVVGGQRSAGSGASQENSTSSTANTSSTPLSRKYPSEDTTLDYSYDNPAMTPSPEAAQLRTKRESSF